MPIIRIDGRTIVLLGKVTQAKFVPGHRGKKTVVVEKGLRRRYANIGDEPPCIFHLIGFLSFPIFFASGAGSDEWKIGCVVLGLLGFLTYGLAYLFYWCNENVLVSYDFLTEEYENVQPQFSMVIEDLYSGENSFSPINYKSRFPSDTYHSKIKNGDFAYSCLVDGKIIYGIAGDQFFHVEKNNISHKKWQDELYKIIFTDWRSPYRKNNINFFGPEFSVSTAPLNDMGGLLGLGFRPWTKFMTGVVEVFSAQRGNLHQVSIKVCDINSGTLNPFLIKHLPINAPTRIQNNHLVSVFFQNDEAIIIFNHSTDRIELLINPLERPHLSTSEPLFLNDEQRLEVLAVEALVKISKDHVKKIFGSAETQQDPYV